MRTHVGGRGAMSKPLAVDLYSGLGGWAEGLLAEGYDVVGFDIERHVYGEHHYPAQLVLQDVLTLHGSQFREAALIVASPPCQRYSYMAMPWFRAKAQAKAIRADTTGEMLVDLTRLFDACFRIQAEASLAAGRHIPMVVENVKGAIPWVGRSRWNFGSFHLWGDVPALMPVTIGRTVMKMGIAHRPDGSTNFHGHKKAGQNWSRFAATGEKSPQWNEGSGLKSVQDGLGGYGGTFGWNNTPMRRGNSRSEGRKRASAMIAKIPEPLSRHIAAVYRP